jgi:hypothetical protein
MLNLPLKLPKFFRISGDRILSGLLDLSGLIELMVVTP